MAFKKSTGLRNKLLGYNQNVVVNPDFASNTASWSAVNCNLALATVDSESVLEVTNNTTAQGQAYQSFFNMQPEREYSIEISVRAGTSDVRVLIGDTTTPDLYYDSGAISNGTSFTIKKGFFIASSNELKVTLQNESTASGDIGYFNYVKVMDEAKSVQDIFANGCIKVYTGAQPSSSDYAPTGTHLVTIWVNSVDGDGIHFADPANGIIKKDGSEIWSGLAIASGDAGWFRLQANSDSEANSTLDERIDGAIANSGAELNMSNTAIESGAVQTISIFEVSIPE